MALKDVGAQNFIRRGEDTGGEMVLVDVDRAVLGASNAEIEQDCKQMEAWKDEIVRQLWPPPLCCIVCSDIRVHVTHT